MNFGEWRITKAQKAEILELWSKLGFTEEDYGLKLDDVYYFQAIGIIDGAQWLIKNPKSWKRTIPPPGPLSAGSGLPE